MFGEKVQNIHTDIKRWPLDMEMKMKKGEPKREIPILQQAHTFQKIYMGRFEFIKLTQTSSISYTSYSDSWFNKHEH
jgi:hypothetical protein